MPQGNKGQKAQTLLLLCPPAAGKGGVSLSLPKAAPPLLPWSPDSLPLWHRALAVTSIGPVSLGLSPTSPLGCAFQSSPTLHGLPHPPLSSTFTAKVPEKVTSLHFSPDSRSGPALHQCGPCSHSRMQLNKRNTPGHTHTPLQSCWMAHPSATPS